MNISDVLAGAQLRFTLPKELAEALVSGIAYDSRHAGKGYVFFAFAGARVDGRRFAQEALTRGAIAIVSELPRPSGFEGPWIEVEHGRRALATASRNFYNRPDERLRFTGITGTNGKTTTAFVLDAILRAAGFTTGLIGTIEYRLGDQVLPAPNTTPESLDLMRFAADLERLGGTHLVAEVSSHALALGRVYGMLFHTGIFTNLTRDHLDFHKTIDEYRDAKALLFHPPAGNPPRWSVLNADDPVSAIMAPRGDQKVIWYGLAKTANLRAENVRSGFSGLRFDLNWDGKRQTIASPLIGHINVLNILAAAGAAIGYGVNLETIAQGIATCRAVPGRFERVDQGQPFLVIVDYAHTDDALRNVIRIARSLTKGSVITLFGCGGDRDRTKRPLMGMAAAELSDFVVLTSDNPRSEDPLVIMNDAMVGIRRFDTPHVAEPDRTKAIRLAITQAKPGDVVLLAGKGHETYQILADRTIPFDDRETARTILRSLRFDAARGQEKQ